MWKVVTVEPVFKKLLDGLTDEQYLRCQSPSFANYTKCPILERTIASFLVASTLSSEQHALTGQSLQCSSSDVKRSCTDFSCPNLASSLFGKYLSSDQPHLGGKM